MGGYSGCHRSRQRDQERNGGLENVILQNEANVSQLVTAKGYVGRRRKRSDPRGRAGTPGIAQIAPMGTALTKNG
jgi:hypothetical protein